MIRTVVPVKVFFLAVTIQQQSTRTLNNGPTNQLPMRIAIGATVHRQSCSSYFCLGQRPGYSQDKWFQHRFKLELIYASGMAGKKPSSKGQVTCQTIGSPMAYTFGCSFVDGFSERYFFASKRDGKNTEHQKCI